MKFEHNPYGTDVLELNEDDLKALGRGEHLKIGRILIGREIPNRVCWYKKAYPSDALVMLTRGDGEPKADLKVTYDGRTGDIVNVEILK